MNIEKLKFPALAVLVAVLVAPLLDKWLNGDYTLLTPVVLIICGTLTAGAVVVGLYNWLTKD